MLDRFRILAGGLDHPEGVAWSPDGRAYAGGEAGQVYEVGLDGTMRQVAATGGFILGLAVDGAGRVYACDVGSASIVRVEPASGALETYTSGALERPMTAPNWLAFAPDGSLFVTDSGNWGRRDGCIWRVAPGGDVAVWSTAADQLPNGCCLNLAGDGLYVIETNRPGVVLIPIKADGSAGVSEVVAELPGTTPDGLALCADGSLLVTCYRPDAILSIATDGAVETLVEDRHGQLLGAPTNLAFAGEALDRLIVANFNRWHLAIGDVGVVGAPLPRPFVP